MVYSTVSKYFKALVFVLGSALVIGCGGGGGGGEDSAASREISLGWDIPTEREDDTALELYEIDGYVIAYGDAPDALETTYTVTGGQVTSHTFNNVDQGTYYFAIATVDSEGVQGLYSDPVQVVVN